MSENTGVSFRHGFGFDLVVDAESARKAEAEEKIREATSVRRVSIGTRPIPLISNTLSTRNHGKYRPLIPPRLIVVFLQFCFDLAAEAESARKTQTERIAERRPRVAFQKNHTDSSNI